MHWLVYVPYSPIGVGMMGIWIKHILCISFTKYENQFIKNITSITNYYIGVFSKDFYVKYMYKIIFISFGLRNSYVSNCAHWIGNG